ncbi:MAG: hypothetical protein IJX28_00680 [Clostridia bacterium]|nr:hypothetical protein [Clostridia bacterium]
MKKSVKIALGVSTAILATAAVAEIVYQLKSIKKILANAEVDEVELDDLFDEEIAAEEAFAELSDAE